MFEVNIETDRQINGLVDKTRDRKTERCCHKHSKKREERKKCIHIEDTSTLDSRRRVRRERIDRKDDQTNILESEHGKKEERIREGKKTQQIISKKGENKRE